MKWKESELLIQLSFLIWHISFEGLLHSNNQVFSVLFSQVKPLPYTDFVPELFSWPYLLLIFSCNDSPSLSFANFNTETEKAMSYHVYESWLDEYESSVSVTATHPVTQSRNVGSCRLFPLPPLHPLSSSLIDCISLTSNDHPLLSKCCIIHQFSPELIQFLHNQPLSFVCIPYHPWNHRHLSG